MRTAVAQGVLAIQADEGDIVLLRPGIEIARVGAPPKRVRRRSEPQGVRRHGGLRGLSAAGPAVLSLGFGGSPLFRLDLDGEHAWQVDRKALVAAAGDGLSFARGRRWFYPRGGGRLVRVAGTGEVWLSASPSPTRVAIEGGKDNAFDARCVVAFSDALDSRSRHDSLKRATASFGGRGHVLVSPGRQGA